MSYSGILTRWLIHRQHLRTSHSIGNSSLVTPAAIIWQSVSWRWQKQASGDARSRATSGDGLQAGETCWGTKHSIAWTVVCVGVRCYFPLSIFDLCLLESTKYVEMERRLHSPSTAYGQTNSNKLTKLTLVTWKRNYKSLNLFIYLVHYYDYDYFSFLFLPPWTLL